MRRIEKDGMVGGALDGVERMRHGDSKRERESE